MHDQTILISGYSYEPSEPSPLHNDFQRLAATLGVIVTNKSVYAALRHQITDVTGRHQLSLIQPRLNHSDMSATMGGTFMQSHLSNDVTQVHSINDHVRAEVVARTIRSAMQPEMKVKRIVSAEGDHRDNRHLIVDTSLHFPLSGIKQKMARLINEEQKNGFPMRNAVIFASLLQGLALRSSAKASGAYSSPEVKLSVDKDRRIELYEFADGPAVDKYRQALTQAGLRIDETVEEDKTVMRFAAPATPEERVALYEKIEKILPGIKTDKSHATEVRRRQLPDTKPETKPQAESAKPGFFGRLFGRGKNKPGDPPLGL